MPVEMDIASEYRYRNPVVGPGDLVIGISQSGETADTLAAMRLARERGATRARGHQRDGLAGHARRRRRAVHARRPRDRRRGDEDVRLPGRRRCTCSALRLAELRGTLAPRAPRRARRRAQAPAALHRRGARAAPSAQVERDRRELLAERVLPLHRPPRRPAGRARGRAEAEGDLLHRDRRLRRRRDEARPDRAARRVARRSSAWRPTRRCSRRSSRTCRRCARAART